MLGREVVIVEAVRTPVGRGHPEKGAYRDVHPNALLGTVFTEVISRSGIEASAVEDVITGCVMPYGEQSLNIGRNAWLQAGLPIETPATTIDRQCGSAQQAVNFGAALVASASTTSSSAAASSTWATSRCRSIGAIARGVREPRTRRELLERYDLIPQGLSAELIAETWGSRARSATRSRFARRSARRARRPKAGSTARSSRSA